MTSDPDHPADAEPRGEPPRERDRERERDSHVREWRRWIRRREA